MSWDVLRWVWNGYRQKGDMKTQRERNDEKRREKLAAIQEQVEQGTLTIRKMTPEERAANPPRTQETTRRRRR
jgi:hypothetical protein